MHTRTTLVLKVTRRKRQLCTDPDTPAEYATVKLTAKVEPSDEDVVFLVDGVPVARVGYPHEFRWSLTPGIHSIRVALLDRPTVSEPITIVVKD